MNSSEEQTKVGARSRSRTDEGLDHLFSFEDLIGIVDEWEASQKEQTA
jgi:hypothetical protein